MVTASVSEDSGEMHAGQHGARNGPFSGVAGVAFCLGNETWSRPESVSCTKPRTCERLLNRRARWALRRMRTLPARVPLLSCRARTAEAAPLRAGPRRGHRRAQPDGPDGGLSQGASGQQRLRSCLTFPAWELRGHFMPDANFVFF